MLNSPSRQEETNNSLAREKPINGRLDSKVIVRFKGLGNNQFDWSVVGGGTLEIGFQYTNSIGVAQNIAGSNIRIGENDTNINQTYTTDINVNWPITNLSAIQIKNESDSNPNVRYAVSRPSSKHNNDGGRLEFDITVSNYQ